MKFSNPWRGLQGLPREVWALCVACFVNRCGTMVLPFLVLYMTQSRGFTARRAGAALTVYGIGSMLVQPVAGRLTDRLGAPRVLRASLFFSALLLLGLATLRSYETILAGVLLWAFANEAFRPAAFALIGEMVTAEQRKPAFALLRLAVNLGMSFGPAIGGFLATRSFGWLFPVDAATTLLAWVVLLRLHVRAPHAHEAAPNDGAPAPGRRVPALADRRLVYFMLGLFPVGVVFFQHLGAMPLYLVRDLRFPTLLFGLLSTLNTGIILLVEVPLNHAMAHWSHRSTMALGALLAGAGFGALGIAHTPWAVAATVVVWTFGEMILFPGSSAYVAEIAPAGRRGEYMGLYSLVFSAALTLGPWMGTAILDAYGASILWAGAFALGCVSTLLLGRLPR